MGGFSIFTSKWLSLFILVLQNSMITIIMRISRTTTGSGLYISSTAVLMCEFLKLLISYCVLCFKNENNYTSRFILINVYNEIVKYKYEVLKLTIPACLYVLQNNLQYIASSYLTASMFQILAQLKIVTTFLFFKLLLKKDFSFI
jgi:UDP-sugar transporter A1/2/3